MTSMASGGGPIQTTPAPVTARAKSAFSVAHVRGIAVELGVHRHGGDSHFAARPHDAHRDLASVGNQNLREHGCVS